MKIDLAEKLKAGLPKSALRFTANTEVTGSKTEGEKGIKVHLKARSKEGIEHWYFGQVYHDFGSMSLPSKVALDDSHGTEIGFARPTLTAWGLELDGVVIPNEENAQHESNRIAYNLREGIPQQASIDFSGDYDLTIVPEGMSSQVNGKTVPGPCCIITNWALRACAICKEGADPNTETTAHFSQGEGPKPRNVVYLRANNENLQNNKEQKPMSQQTQADEGKKPEANEQQTQTAAAPKPEGQQTQKPDEGKKPETQQSQKPAEDIAAQLQAEQGKNAELSAKVAALETKLSALTPGTNPVPSEAGAQGQEKSLWTQYNEIKDPSDRTLFYRKHKDAMDNEAKRK